jgi:hypothetical protein
MTGRGEGDCAIPLAGPQQRSYPNRGLPVAPVGAAAVQPAYRGRFARWRWPGGWRGRRPGRGLPWGVRRGGRGWGRGPGRW